MTETIHFRFALIQSPTAILAFRHSIGRCTCWRPEVKNMTIVVNSIYNSWRMEDVRLDR